MEYVLKTYSKKCDCDSAKCTGSIYFWLREMWFILLSFPCICIDMVHILAASFLSIVLCGRPEMIPFPSKYNNFLGKENWLEMDAKTPHTGEGYTNESFDKESCTDQEPSSIQIDHDSNGENSANENDTLREFVQETRDHVASKFGLSPLHQAIMNNAVDQVQKLVAKENFRDMLTQETEFYFGETFKRGASLPLAMAVLNGNTDIVEILVNSGAPLDQADKDGYTVFHTVVLAAGSDFERASKMYDILIAFSVQWWDKEKGHEENRHADSAYSEIEAVYYLLNLKTNRRQLTPLELAATLGYKNMMEKILNTEYAYKFTIFPSQKQEVAFYDVKDIDPNLNDSRAEPSVAELIITSENDKALECLDIPLLNNFLQRKWDDYFPYFVAETVAYFIYMCVFTSNIYHETYIQNMTRNGTEISLTDYILQFRFTNMEIFLIIGVTVYTFIGITSFVSSTRLLLKRQIIYGSIYLLWRRFLVATYEILSSSLVFIWLGTKIKGYPEQRVFQILILVLGWTFLLFFMHGFRLTAFFSVMVERLLVKGVLLFAVCYSFITIGFASAIVVNLRFNGEYPPNYSDIENAFFSLFRLTFGLVEAEELFDRENYTRTTYGLNIALFTGYVILCLLLLLNMLIASMSDTYAQISTQRHLFWKRLRAFNIYLLEQRLPSVLQRFSSYYPVRKFKIKGKNEKEIVEIDREIYLFRI